MAFDKKQFSDIYDSMAADTRQRLPALTDFEEGSVVRTLYESFAYELAVLYEQMDQVYRAGFIDTAQGPNLDRVVAVLGMTRNEPDFAAGEVVFERDPGLDEPIRIPLGTLLTTEEDEAQEPPKKAYVTTENAVMQASDIALAVKVQAEERGRVMTAEAGAIVVMPRPIPGIKSVSNPDPIRFRGRDRETDAALRARAKQTLLASGRASTASIENALLGMPGVREVCIHEDFRSLDDGGLGHGISEVYVDGMRPDNAEALRQHVDQVRAAGVYILLKPVVATIVDAVLRIELDAGIASEERLDIEEQVREAVTEFLDCARMGQAFLLSQLTATVLDTQGVTDLADLHLVTYREVDAFARGEVVLTRAADLDVDVVVEAQTRLYTATGQGYVVMVAVGLPPGVASATAPVQAVLETKGQAGELQRSGSASAWETVTVQGVVLTVANAAPILLTRTAHEPTARRIDADIFERFMPGRIRVASEEKALPVHVQIRLLNTSDATPGKRDDVQEEVRDFFDRLQMGQSFTQAELEASLTALLPGGFALRLVLYPFQHEVLADVFLIEAVSIEKAEPENIFVYRDRLELTGRMTLVLPLTATDAERRAACGAVRQAIADYLERLQPEEDADLTQLPEFAVAQEHVLRVVLQPEAFGVERVSGNVREVLDNRNRGDAIGVEAFEKLFLAADGFVIEAT